MPFKDFAHLADAAFHEDAAPPPYAEVSRPAQPSDRPPAPATLAAPTTPPATRAAAAPLSPSAASAHSTPAARPTILGLLKQYWGYDELRPLQAEAIAAGIERRDSLVVMPTGGGKSLCYQIPPLLTGRADIVVSPLIALMKDQVDGLRAIGYPAAAIHSGTHAPEQSGIFSALHNGRLRLLFVAPERLLTPGFIRLIQGVNVHSFAIDEAHCISHWGHDFRPEYRRLAELKQHFPSASMHAFTATATQRVREDIVLQLGLRDPAVLVGSFDRPNLIYRVIPRSDRDSQIKDILKRHKGEAAIVYCISRRDTEDVTAMLHLAGFRAAFYHAGMGAESRRRTQDAFAQERLDIIVATVAFGMGIDRSDIRCVIHAAMPKSVEHYQQESGRAGRDGLAAECVLLYSPADAIKWQGLMERSAEENDVPPTVVAKMLGLLRHMQNYAGSLDCRHAALVQYFGQPFEKTDCAACDVCLGEIEGLEDGTILAQKILSCVARVQQRFGVGHVVDVLKGARTERIQTLRHDHLSTYALLAEMDKKVIQRRVYDLLDQELLRRSEGEMPVLLLNDASWEVMRGRRKVMLRKIEERGVKATRVEAVSWEGVDRGLFEKLRELRRLLAEEKQVAAFVIFHDRTLWDLARRRPTSMEGLRSIDGLGKSKAEQFGERLRSAIEDYCREQGLPVNVRPSLDRSKADPDTKEVAEGGAAWKRRRSNMTAAKAHAFKMFAEGVSLEEVAAAIDRAPSTTANYLVEYILDKGLKSLNPWVNEAAYARVSQVVREKGTRMLKPIFDELNGEVSYDIIKLVAAHVESEGKNE